MTDQEVKQVYNSARWQRVRDRILIRDRYECQDCIQRLRTAAEKEERLFGEDAKIRRATQVHHIKELKENPELAFDEENLISLCTQCHNIRHGRQPKRFVKKKEPVRRKMVEKFRNKKEIPPGEFSMKNFLVENGDVAMTLEKFSRARERGTL